MPFTNQVTINSQIKLYTFIMLMFPITDLLDEEGEMRVEALRNMLSLRDSTLMLSKTTKYKHWQ